MQTELIHCQTASFSASIRLSTVSSRRLTRALATFTASLLLVGGAFAQTNTAAPAKAPEPPKHIPPPGVMVPDAERAELTAGAAALGKEIDQLAGELAGNPRLLALLPDVEVFHKAVDWALRYDEFFTPKEIKFAHHLLDEGRERVAQLRAGKAPWLEATGLVVRGYRSKLDGSVQPYGLVVPETWRDGQNRVMVWLLGRGEKRTELAFLAEREGGPGGLTPTNTLVVVPYGRFCNATKFAGEVDVFEALDAARAQYSVDTNRILVAGFSMGGGSTWHLAAHHSGLWCAASPGAGFAETAVFSHALAPGHEPRPWWEQKLWAWCDATIVAGNLFNCPTIAYSGEIDGQKQAADIMDTAMAGEGLKLERFIGPKTGHAYEPQTKVALTARLEELLNAGRSPQPTEVRLSTYTLRYPEASWVRIEGMGKQWERADVRARLTDQGTIVADTTNVTAIAFHGVRASTVSLDGQRLSGAQPDGDTGLHFKRDGRKWHLASATMSGVHKSPGLNGPIDDAFMDPFLFVRPTGKALNDDVGRWTQSELNLATNLWRDLFRGDAPVKDDKNISDEDIASKNLVLWGDPSSNLILAKILKHLPLKWDRRELVFKGHKYDATHFAPILVFPNPLNPRHYVVLNSGIDFRTDAYGSNALQTPKLPDWAIIDLSEAPGPRWPGRVAEAGFFDEEWK